MRREEKKRKFHEAVVNMLFPPSIDNEYDDVPDIIPTEHDTVPLLSDNAGDSYSSLPEEDTNNDGGMEFQKQQPTRAQRKRIRKKRLKEESARRGKMIGPLFPSNGDVMYTKGEESCGVAKDDALDVQNDGKMRYDDVPSKGGERSVCDNMKKLKQRRAAKRRAKSVSKLSNSEKKDGNVDLIKGLGGFYRHRPSSSDLVAGLAFTKFGYPEGNWGLCTGIRNVNKGRNRASSLLDF